MRRRVDRAAARAARSACGWPIRLTHEQVTYFQTTRLRDFAPDRFPIWIWHGAEEFYGFPVFGNLATKAAKEVCGDDVDLATWDRVPDAERVRRVGEFVEEILPGYGGPELFTRCCLYDLPPDRDFVVDRVPGHPQRPGLHRRRSRGQVRRGARTDPRRPLHRRRHRPADRRRSPPTARP